MSIFRFLDYRIWPERSDPPYENEAGLRVLFQDLLLDAFPIILISAVGLSLLPPMTAYDAATVTEGKGVLLVSREVDRWFAGTRPPVEVVAEARAQIEPILLSDRQYQERRRAAIEDWMRGEEPR